MNVTAGSIAMRIAFSFRLLLACAISVALFSGQAGAEPITHPLNPIDTSSPRTAIDGFLRNVTEAHRNVMEARNARQRPDAGLAKDLVRAKVMQADDNLARAARVFDLSAVPATSRQRVRLEATILLKEVLDRLDLPAKEAIPDRLEVRETGVTKWRFPGTEIEIALIAEGPRAGEFLFTTATVARLSEFYTRVESHPYRETTTAGFYDYYIRTPGRLLEPQWLQWTDELPAWLLKLYGGQTVWQWLGLALILVIALTVPVILQSTRPKWRPAAALPASAWWNLVIPAVTLVLFLTIHQFIDDQLNITGRVLDIALIGLEVLTFATAAWLAVLLGIALAESIIASPRIDPASIDASLVRMCFRTTSGALAIFLVIEGARRVGVPLVPLLAGLGFGGLALALAARPTIENLIGGILLFADRPVRVGDFCSFDDKFGQVDAIGLRSSRIRALDRSIITIPNADFANMQLVNWSRRDRMMIRSTLRLRHETPPNRLRYILAKLREMLLAHPSIYADQVRVRLQEFAPSSLDIELSAFAETTDYDAFLAIQEDVLLRTIDVVEGAGAEFARPAQTTYLTRDKGLDETLGEAADATVTKWIEEGTLPFPEHSQSYRDKIRGSLDYPPKGSVDSSGPSSKKPKDV